MLEEPAASSCTSSTQKVSEAAVVFLMKMLLVLMVLPVVNVQENLCHEVVTDIPVQLPLPEVRSDPLSWRSRLMSE